MIQAREAIERLLRRFLIWRAQNLDTSTFLVLVAVVTGLISGLVAVVLKNAAHAVRELVVAERLNDIYQVAYFLFPLVGISIVMVLRRSLKWRMREGIPMALSSIAKDGGIIPRSGSPGVAASGGLGGGVCATVHAQRHAPGRALPLSLHHGQSAGREKARHRHP